MLTIPHCSGIFSQFSNLEYDKYVLAGMVGDELAHHTKFEAAIRLYFIGGQLDKALRLLSSLLTQVVHQRAEKGSIREQLSVVAERMDESLRRRNADVDDHVMRTYRMLTELLKFFDYYHAGQSRLAIDVLNRNRITPSNCAEVDECVNKLKLVGSEMIKVLPDVLLAAMDLIYGQYLETRAAVNVNGRTTSPTDELLVEPKEEMLSHLRQRAKALTNMAATLPYRMPSDTNNRLVQLEILMH